MASFQMESVGGSSKRAVFLLAGWQNKLWMYRLFAYLLAWNGFYCIICAYDDDVFSPDTEKTVKELLSIRNAVLRKVAQLKDMGITEFSLFGTSLGSMIAILVANASPDVSKVILNTTGLDLAEVVWSWNHGNYYFKRELQSQHFNSEKLRVAWAPINPVNNLDHMHGKKFLVFLSKKDEIIPYELGRQLVDHLREKGVPCHVVVNRTLGHILTGMYNLFNAPLYLSFLKK